MKKRIIPLILVLCLLLPMVNATVSASNIVVSGSCGSSASWVLTTDGTLTISGEGKLTHHDFTIWQSYLSRINAIVVEDGITHIGDHAFYYDYQNVTSISLPDTLVSIGEMAFTYCDSLTAIEIPESVTHLGKHAFFSCDSLTDVTLYGSLGIVNESVFQDCNSLKFVAIPEGIREIDDTAFGSCELLETVALPESLEIMGTYLFSYCPNLKTVTIPSAVTLIEDYAFDHCPSLEQVVFEGDAPTFGNLVFQDTATTVYYPADNPTWTTELMHNHGGTIEWVPYSGAVELASGWSGNTTWSLTHDGVLTFTGSGNMKNYEYGESRPWSDYVNFITDVVIEEGIHAIGECAFKDLPRLESVQLPDSGLQRIGEAAFYGCTGLKQIHIPDGVYTIQEYTFKNCSALSSIRLPGTLIKISQGAFENCTALPYLFVPGDTEIIGSWSFKGCTGLEEADMQWTNATEIRAGAFKNCSSLTEIILPPHIQVLGDSCFYGIGAESFTVPATVTGVGPWCFARAELTEIIFEGDAPAIGKGAFNKITLTARYPGSNATWTMDLMQNYGGNVTWLEN